MIYNEGNISNGERTLRQVRSIIHGYRPKVDMDSVSFSKTTKGNWMVKDTDDKKICVISKFIMSYQDACDLGYCKPAIEENMNESEISGLTDKDSILEQIGVLGIPVKNCIIRDNGVVDLIKDTTIKNKNISKIGLQFGECKGNFDISGCKYLESLMGCPDDVQGDFNCSGTGIKKLQGCPDYITGNFVCEDCSKLNSVKDSPIKVDGDIILSGTNIDSSYLKKMCKIKGEIIL